MRAMRRILRQARTLRAALAWPPPRLDTTREVCVPHGEGHLHVRLACGPRRFLVEVRVGKQSRPIARLDKRWPVSQRGEYRSPLDLEPLVEGALAAAALRIGTFLSRDTGFAVRTRRTCRPALADLFARWLPEHVRPVLASLPGLLWRLRRRGDELALQRNVSTLLARDRLLQLADTLVNLGTAAGPRALADVARYPAGFARHLVDAWQRGEYREFVTETDFQPHGDSACWQALILTARPWLQRLSEPVGVGLALRDALDRRLVMPPRTRLGWLAAEAWLDWSRERRRRERFADDQLHIDDTPVDMYDPGPRRRLELAFPTSGPARDVALAELAAATRFDGYAWRAWRRASDAPAVPNVLSLRDCFAFVQDGVRLRAALGTNTRLELVAAAGSLARAVRASAWNHHQARLARCAILESVREVVRPGYPGFPSELEALRLATVGAMLDAGDECRTCLGSVYAFDEDLFLRRGETCLQLDRYRLTVVQCFDRDNRRTSTNREFEAYVQERIAAWRAKPDFVRQSRDDAAFIDACKVLRDAGEMAGRLANLPRRRAGVMP